LNGDELPLTRTEYALLAALVGARGGTVSRAELASRIAPRSRGRSNVVDVHLCRLREKLGAQGALIQTVHRSGVRLRAERIGAP
jgi:DNA-binding response OmpR family regulator